ncbi:MAG: hypothetical protein P3C10_09965 [Gemmatimonadota bacterium]|nr:hypothetical protein [Gemmatimonadota bacterium]
MLTRSFMHLTGSADVEHALGLVGELLAAAGHEYAVAILGGAALNLLGVVDRSTTDVDILAFATPQTDVAPEPSTLREPPVPMPAPLVRAAATVARDLGLDPHWLNAGPALQWRTGLPPGMADRVMWRRYSALWVGLVARYDLISFKLFAAADSSGPRSVHYQDLLALRPTAAELDDALRWVQTQDASPAFADVLDQVAMHVRTDLDIA